MAHTGFLLGLICAIVSILAGLNFLVSFAAALYLPSLTVPSLSSGEVILLLLAVCPVALVGLALSILGWRSTTRNRQAVAGVALCSLALLPIAVGILVIYLSWSQCHSCL